MQVTTTPIALASQCHTKRDPAFQLQLYTFDAYGNLLEWTNAQPLTNYLYSGESFDFSIGQQYLRARFYDATTGRFNRLDPFFGNSADPQSFHKYGYVHSDPIHGVDPTGMFLGIALQVAFRSSINGGIFGAIIGALRSFGDSVLDDRSNGASDILMNTIQGAVQGATVGAAIGFIGPYIGALHMIAQVAVVGSVVSFGVRNGIRGISESMGRGDYDQAALRTAWTVVDSMLGAFAIGGSAAIRAGNSGKNLDGGTRLQGNGQSMYLIAMEYLLSRLHVKLTIQPEGTTRPVGFTTNTVGGYRASERSITLQSEATWATLLHETSHALTHWVKGNGYKSLPERAKEQAAYDLMRSFFWGLLNSKEQAAARVYAKHKGADPW